MKMMDGELYSATIEPEGQGPAGMGTILTLTEEKNCYVLWLRNEVDGFKPFRVGLNRYPAIEEAIDVRRLPVDRIYELAGCEYTDARGLVPAPDPAEQEETIEDGTGTRTRRQTIAAEDPPPDTPKQ